MPQPVGGRRHGAVGRRDVTGVDPGLGQPGGGQRGGGQVAGHPEQAGVGVAGPERGHLGPCAVPPPPVHLGGGAVLLRPHHQVSALVHGGGGPEAVGESFQGRGEVPGHAGHRHLVGLGQVDDDVLDGPPLAAGRGQPAGVGSVGQQGLELLLLGLQRVHHVAGRGRDGAHGGRGGASQMGGAGPEHGGGGGQSGQVGALHPGPVEGVAGQDQGLLAVHRDAARFRPDAPGRGVAPPLELGLGDPGRTDPRSGGAEEVGDDGLVVVVPALPGHAVRAVQGQGVQRGQALGQVVGHERERARGELDGAAGRQLGCVVEHHQQGQGGVVGEVVQGGPDPRVQVHAPGVDQGEGLRHGGGEDEADAVDGAVVGAGPPAVGEPFHAAHVGPDPHVVQACGQELGQAGHPLAHGVAGVTVGLDEAAAPFVEVPATPELVHQEGHLRPALGEELSAVVQAGLADAAGGQPSTHGTALVHHGDLAALGLQRTGSRQARDPGAHHDHVDRFRPCRPRLAHGSTVRNGRSAPTHPPPATPPQATISDVGLPGPLRAADPARERRGRCRRAPGAAGARCHPAGELRWG